MTCKSGTLKKSESSVIKDAFFTLQIEAINKSILDKISPVLAICDSRRTLSKADS